MAGDKGRGPQDPLGCGLWKEGRPGHAGTGQAAPRDPEGQGCRLPGRARPGRTSPRKTGSGIGSESTKSAWALPVRSNVPDAHARPGGRRRRSPWVVHTSPSRTGGALLPLSSLTAALVSQHPGPHFIIHNCPAQQAVQPQGQPLPQEEAEAQRHLVACLRTHRCWWRSQDQKPGCVNSAPGAGSGALPDN